MAQLTWQDFLHIKSFLLPDEVVVEEELEFPVP